MGRYGSAMALLSLSQMEPSPLPITSLKLCWLTLGNPQIVLHVPHHFPGPWFTEPQNNSIGAPGKERKGICLPPQAGTCLHSPVSLRSPPACWGEDRECLMS